MPPEAREPIKVLLVDDDALVRAGIRAILASDPALHVVGEAENGRRGLSLATQLNPDVVLLDIRMPVLDGLETLAELAARPSGPQVIMLTTFGEEQYIDRALSLGAAGFLLKSSDPRELIAAVHAVASGAAALSPRIARRVIERVRSIDDAAQHRAATAIAALTPREHEVLALVGAGLSNAEIASRLHLSETTVKGHVSAILLKLDARNRVDAAILAFQAGNIVGG